MPVNRAQRVDGELPYLRPIVVGGVAHDAIITPLPGVAASHPDIRWRNTAHHRGFVFDWAHLRRLISAVGGAKPAHSTTTFQELNTGATAFVCGSWPRRLIVAVGVDLEFAGLGTELQMVVPRGAHGWPQEDVGRHGWAFLASMEEALNADQAFEVVRTWLESRVVADGMMLRDCRARMSNRAERS